jgi:hypothetical protein
LSIERKEREGKSFFREFSTKPIDYCQRSSGAVRGRKVYHIDFSSAAGAGSQGKKRIIPSLYSVSVAAFWVLPENPES